MNTEPDLLREAIDRLQRFTQGESGYAVYPGGIFMTDGPSPFYDDLRAVLALATRLSAAHQPAGGPHDAELRVDGEGPDAGTAGRVGVASGNDARQGDIRSPALRPEKRCFTYCGDDKCDCGLADPFAIIPHSQADGDERNAHLAHQPAAPAWGEDTSGRAWTKVRAQLQPFAERYTKATRYEEASAIADGVAAKIVNDVLALTDPEAVARVIDPERWALWDEGQAGGVGPWDHAKEDFCRDSLAKARTIIAMAPPADARQSAEVERRLGEALRQIKEQAEHRSFAAAAIEPNERAFVIMGKWFQEFEAIASRALLPTPPAAEGG